MSTAPVERVARPPLPSPSACAGAGDIRDNVSCRGHSSSTRMRWRMVRRTRPMLGRALEDAARFVEIATGVQHEFDPQPSRFHFSTL
jgi:hypothetical protein